MRKFIIQNKIILIGFIFLFLLGISLFIFFFTKPENVTNTLAFLPEEKEVIIEENIDSNDIYFNVDIKGAVETPGVYSLKEGTLIIDAIKAAGDFKWNAYEKNINLSKKISDEMVIYVYNESEIKEADIVVVKSEEIYIDENLDNQETLIDDKITNNQEITTLININTATIEEIMSLPGIGESKANSIIEYRETSLFKSIDEIMQISGIGQSTYESLKDLITI